MKLSDIKYFTHKEKKIKAKKNGGIFFFKDEKTLQNLVVFACLQPGHKETFLWINHTSHNHEHFVEEKLT